MMAQQFRRVRLIRVNSNMLAHILTEGVSYRIQSGLPADAAVVAVFVDPFRQGTDLLLHIESATFPPVATGAALEAIEIMVTRV